ARRARAKFRGLLNCAAAATPASGALPAVAGRAAVPPPHRSGDARRRPPASHADAMELNPIYASLDDLKARTLALRGYL
ncbi:MAG: hypothetical protein U0S76_11415, partial [Pseudoxanthomonas sp.]|nr:hypothetical protein [Pseudoxanthomonas sp.]